MGGVVRMERNGYLLPSILIAICFWGGGLAGIAVADDAAGTATGDGEVGAAEGEASSESSYLALNQDAGDQGGVFRLDRLDAYLEFESDFDYSRIKSSPRSGAWGGLFGGRWFGRELGQDRRDRQVNEDWRFEERVGLSLDGSVIDPGIMTFAADMSFAMVQNRSKERGNLGGSSGWPFDDDRSGHDSGYLLQYDIRANFLTGKPLSGSAYMLKQDDRINRRFQPTLREDRTGFGTSWTYVHDTFPMELTYDYSETDRTGNRDEWDDEHFTESVLHFGGEWIFTPYHRLTYSYEHAETKQEYQGLDTPFDTTRDLITLEHELEFGDQRKHSFRTLFHWQEESGDFARDFFEIGPQLTLQHTEDLQTMWKYQFNRERYEGLDVETHRADWQLVRQWYRNLTMTVDVFGLYEDVNDDVDTTQYGASADWQYNRKNPWGRLYANLALAYDSEHQKGHDGPRLVLNESGAFRDPLPIRLLNRNAILTSVVVTDATGRRIFLPGVDYLVVQTRDVTRLMRVVTGRIANGDTVLVDYQYEVPGRGQLDTLRVDAGVEQRFSGLSGDGSWANGLTPYYRFSYRNQEDDYSSRFVSWTADRTDHHRWGARYEQTKYTLGLEYEVYDDTVEPYQAFHVDGLWHIVSTPAHTVDASSRLSRFWFEGGIDDRNVNMLDVELDHRWRLGESLSTFERLLYRWEDDSVDGMTHGWDASAGFEYVVGMFTAQLSIDYDRLDLPGSTEDDVGVWLRLRRDIPNLLR